MARATLPAALKLVFGDEGGYSNVKTDKGGPTKYGITHKTLAAHRGVPAVSAEQVRAMSLAEATAVYERSYWAQSGGDLLPVGLDYAAFDFGVNSGPARAVKALQKAVGMRQDGVVGEQTLDAVRKYPGGVSAVIRAYCDERMRFLRSLGGAQGFAANGRGWTIRVTGKDPKGQWAAKPGVLGHALKLASDAGAVVTPSDTGEGRAKADVSATSVIEIAKKPEAWGPITGLLTAAGALTAGSGPVQWAMALAMVALVGVGLFYLVRQIRAA